MFNYDVKCTNTQDGKAWDKQTSMCTVKKMMASNDVRVTRRLLEQSGALADATVYKASVAAKAKDGAYIGMKTKSSVFADVSKYGGMTKIKNAYSIIVQYTGKKNEVIKEIVPLPIYLTNRNTTDNDLIEYVKSVIPQTKDISIIYKKLCINQLVKVNGFYYYLGGKTSNSICIDNAVPVLFSAEFEVYLKLIDKFSIMQKSNPSINIKNVSTLSTQNNHQVFITVEDNIKLYDYFIDKLNSNIYQKMKGNKVNDLISIGRDRFIELPINTQCVLLLEILNMLTNMKTTYDIKLLGFSTSRTKIALKISNLNEFRIINESITGLYSNEVTIV